MTGLNIGCGKSPTRGWRNFDNSLSLRLAACPLLPRLLFRAGLLARQQFEFIQFARANSIEYGDATKGLPVAAGSADAVYSSHMLEHLSPGEAVLFLAEAKRILRRGGILRLSVPDLRRQVMGYIDSGDADAFVSATHLASPDPEGAVRRLKMLLVGSRHHQWMYDGASLCRLLARQGFLDPVVLNPGESLIEDPQGLDLHERHSESVYVEARNP